MAKVNDGKIVASFDVFESVLTWNFVGGEALEFDVRKAVNVTEVDVYGSLPDIGQKALLHGFKQKISDAGAMSRDTKTGLPPEPSARIEKMRRVAEALESGQWELARTGGGGGGDSVLVRALVIVFNKPADVVRPWLKSKSPAERAALKADKKVAKVIASIEAESAKGVDTSALLAELD